MKRGIMENRQLPESIKESICGLGRNQSLTTINNKETIVHSSESIKATVEFQGYKYNGKGMII